MDSPAAVPRPLPPVTAVRAPASGGKSHHRRDTAAGESHHPRRPPQAYAVCAAVSRPLPPVPAVPCRLARRRIETDRFKKRRPASENPEGTEGGRHRRSGRAFPRSGPGTSVVAILHCRGMQRRYSVPRPVVCRVRVSVRVRVRERESELVRARVCVRARAGVRACVRAWGLLGACVRACVRGAFWVRACVRVPHTGAGPLRRRGVASAATAPRRRSASACLCVPVRSSVRRRAMPCRHRKPIYGFFCEAANMCSRAHRRPVHPARLWDASLGI